MPEYDLREYIKTQQQESYRAFIIYAPPMSHKTRLARELRDKLGAHLFDLQSHFVTHPELAAQINTFRAANLEKLLLSLGVPESIIVVDNIDFLINVWTPRHKRDFVAMLDLRFRTSVTDKTFIFMMQPDRTIMSQILINTLGQPRILPLEAFFAPW